MLDRSGVSAGFAEDNVPHASNLVGAQHPTTWMLRGQCVRFGECQSLSQLLRRFGRQRRFIDVRGDANKGDRQPRQKLGAVLGTGSDDQRAGIFGWLKHRKFFDFKGLAHYYARPFGVSFMSIPATVQASVALAKGARYEGELALKLLPRLAELIQPTSGPIQVNLEASRAMGYSSLKGSVGGRLELRCQRCEKIFEWTLDADVNLRLVSSEAEEHQLLQDCEPYCVSEDTLPLREMVEEEVLLALPMLARCESCENSVNAAPAKVKQTEPRRQNPFVGLKDKLKH